MLENIKSIFVLKEIFSYTNDYDLISLNLFKYNKALQNKININLIHYKFFSGRYIVYEENNKAKEYNCYNHILRYEGEYSNKKRNGKGKEYDYNGDLIYEGEFLNGKRNGKGKEYDFINFLKFEGEFFNGKKWNGIFYDKKDKNITYELKEGKGFIKEYNKNSNLIFEGEYLKGEKYKGKEYYDNGKLNFIGEYFDGKRWNGKVYNKKNIIISEFKNGKGFLKTQSKKIPALNYEEEYFNGKINGIGKEYFLKNIICEGEYKNGKKTGKGKEYNYKFGNVTFEGEYLYDEKLKGKEFINEKLEYEGDYLFGRKWNGKGYNGNGDVIYELINGSGEVKEYNLYNEIVVFEGKYLNGEKNGLGKEYDDFSGKLIFKGDYLNGKRNGKGKEYDDDGKLEFEGEYLNGKRNGKGKEYRYGTLLFNGEYSNGKRKK